MCDTRYKKTEAALVKGTRDFTAHEIYKRRHVVSILRKNFESFGFEPLETPVFEKLSTLTGKYGEEGDRLIFKVLNSGDYAQKVEGEDWDNREVKRITPQISEKALRYDLTIPFARYVAMNSGKLSFPFKRYQIQPVWRADRPQRGRFREFYQCDADVVGSESPWQEVEFLDLYCSAFSALKLPVKIHLNNRKILSGLSQYAQIQDQFQDFVVALDKLEKLGKENVVREMKEKGISDRAISKLDFLFEEKCGGALESLRDLKEILHGIEVGLSGIEEMETIFSRLSGLGLAVEDIVFDVRLARGLDYYTGSIFEVKVCGVDMGSVGGGGRYDNLTGVFGVKNISGVGISFGLDRICMVMDELGLFPEMKKTLTQFLFTNHGEEEALEALKIVRLLRKKGIQAELYPDNAKLKKQLNYAENRGITKVVFLGKEEIEQGVVSVRDLERGEQNTFSQKDFLA